MKQHDWIFIFISFFFKSLYFLNIILSSISYLKSSDSFSVTLEMGNVRSCMGVRIQKGGSVLDLPLIKHTTLTFTT